MLKPFTILITDNNQNSSCFTKNVVTFFLEISTVSLSCDYYQLTSVKNTRKNCVPISESQAITQCSDTSMVRLVQAQNNTQLHPHELPLGKIYSVTIRCKCFALD